MCVKVYFHLLSLFKQIQIEIQCTAVFISIIVKLCVLQCISVFKHITVFLVTLFIPSLRAQMTDIAVLLAPF